MTLDALRCFCAIVDSGSFKSAAARVHRSQPAVSQQLKTLEREVGHQLIDRRSNQATPLGKLLYARARQLLVAAESLEHEVRDYDESAATELRVGASDTTAIYLLPPYVSRFLRDLPSTHLTLISRSSGEVVRQVLAGELDVGVVTLPEEEPELEAVHLHEQRLLPVAAAGHALAGRRRLRMRDLAEEPMLLLSEETRTGAKLHAWLRQQGVKPEVLLDSGSFEVLKQYVYEGAGISFLPEPAVRAAPPGALAVLQLDVQFAVDIGAIWRKGAYKSRAAAHFLGLLQEL